MLIKRRPWWKFWPVVCWRNWRIVRKDEQCDRCARESAFKFRRSPSSPDRGK